MLSSFKTAARIVGEKTGKIQGTQESEEFVAKCDSLNATNAAFKNLQRVGKSIFANYAKEESPPENPAVAFLAEINEVILVRKDYNKKRLAYDSSEDVVKKREEDAKKPGKNQQKKELLAQTARDNRDQKQIEYKSARDNLQARIEELEKKRDDQFKQSVQAMCTLLGKLTPDWENVASEEKAHSSGADHGDDEKDNGGNDTNPDFGGSGAQQPDPAEGENTQNQTDSESD